VSSEEDLLRRGLAAAASRAAAPPDLFDKVAGARISAKRKRTWLAVAGGALATCGIAVVSALSTFSTTQVTAAVGTGASRGPATGATLSCPTTSADPQHAPFNDWRGPTRVDPATTRVLVCGYAPRTTNPLTWRLDKSAELAAQQAASLVGHFNGAPTADPLKRCPSAGHEELWFFVTGSTLTAEVRVQIGGCGDATDGAHSVSWLYPDPLAGDSGKT
jgi:hypothetical protein